MLNRSSGNLRFTFMMFCRTLLVLVLLFAYSSASTSPKPQELKHRKGMWIRDCRPLQVSF